MYLSTSLSALALLAVSCSAIPHPKRTTAVPLYAYGTNISGLALYYGNSDGNLHTPVSFL
jgi:hypothetical protein